jgi:mono/diheme cytochrome c family protein
MYRMSIVGWLIIVVVALAGATARAENLDQGKSGAELFAATCAECHRSPRGLVKDRMSWTLSYFLRRHYTSSWASAQTLTAYLQSVEAPRATAPRAGRKSLPPAMVTSEPALRPPAPVPGR